MLFCTSVSRFCSVEWLSLVMPGSVEGSSFSSRVSAFNLVLWSLCDFRIGAEDTGRANLIASTLGLPCECL